jgi:hypothetical protein
MLLIGVACGLFVKRDIHEKVNLWLRVVHIYREETL